MAGGSDVSREELKRFADKADAASQNMTNAVRNMESGLSVLAGRSAGAFAAKFIEVKAQVEDELTVLNQALAATSTDARSAGVQFSAGDEDQQQTVGQAVSGVVGLSAGLPI